MNNNTSLLSSHHSLTTSSPGLVRERSLSPSRVRINQLGQRLNDLQGNIEADKTNKSENMDTRIKQLEDEVNRDHHTNEMNLKDLKHQVNKVQEGVATETVARELLDDRKSKEIRLIEKNIALDVDAEKNNRRDTESRIVNKIEEKINALRVDVDKEQRKENEIVEKQTKDVVDQINDLQSILDNEKKSRKEGSDKLARRLEDEVKRIEHMIAAEKKVREQSENALFKLLEEVNNKLQGEINSEQVFRSRAEEQMLSLLEETCNKIETQLKYH